MELVNTDTNLSQRFLFMDESSIALSSRHNPTILQYWSEQNDNVPIVT